MVWNYSFFIYFDFFIITRICS